MAEQAGIRTFLLSKALRHLRVGNVIYLMGSCAEKKPIYNPRHMTGDATACFRIQGVMGMRRRIHLVLELRMASGAHAVLVVFESQ